MALVMAALLHAAGIVHARRLKDLVESMSGRPASDRSHGTGGGLKSRESGPIRQARLCIG
jgi:hypothetical protein